MKHLRSRRGPSAAASVFLMLMTRLPILCVLTLCSVVATAYAQQGGNGSVVVKPRAVTPKQYIQGDVNGPDSTNSSYVPGDVNNSFTPQQDSAYRAAMQLDVSGSVRFLHSARSLLSAMRIQPNDRNISPWEAAAANMAIPNSVLAPTSQEVALYRANIAAS